MFEKDQFIEYVGAASGSSYASGLSNIERLYSVDIDEEYEKDSCKELLSRLDELKRETGITQAELSNRQNRYSNLKKYIEFRNGGKVRMVDQYRRALRMSQSVQSCQGRKSLTVFTLLSARTTAASFPATTATI